MADDNDDAAARTRRRRTSTGMDGMSALPEHLQLEVFSRVGDVKALFRFALTCRGWLRRFTDAAFLRELYPGSHGGSGSGVHHHRARLLGVFLQEEPFNLLNKARVQARVTTMAAPPQQRASSPVFLPALGSPLGPAGRAVTSFGGGDDGDRTFDYAMPLAARRGIVLAQLAPRTREEIESCHLFGVYNPITGDRHVLPPLEWSLAGSRLISYAIITAADGSRRRDGDDDDRPPAPAAAAAARWTFSQLLVITARGDRARDGGVEEYAYLNSYSAATQSWSRCVMDRRVDSLVGDKSGVVHGGAAHWLCVHDGRSPYEPHDHLYRLSVEVATVGVSWSCTSLPVRAGGQPLLCVNSDDAELVAVSVHPMHVTVWTPPAAGVGDDDGGDTTTPAAWPRTSFRIAPPRHHLESWCNFNHGSLIALFREHGIFILDLDTKVMEEVLVVDFNAASSNVAWFQYPACVPYEMDLLEFFTLQLGGIQQRLTLSQNESS